MLDGWKRRQVTEGEADFGRKSEIIFLIGFGLAV